MKKDTTYEGMLMKRRQFLKVSALGGAALCLPLGLARQFAYAEASPSVTHFKDPLPKPRVFQPDAFGAITVGMRELQQALHSDIGPVTTVWGYGDNGGFSFPGPTFEARTGQLTRVTWVNELGVHPNQPHYLEIDPAILNAVHGAQDNRKAVVHLHGGHVTAVADGYPKDTILPGEQVTYDYDIDQQAATLWYHDHALGNTRLNVYMGLAGFFLIRDDVEGALVQQAMLPGSDYEYPLVFQDRRVNGDGSLGYDRMFDDSFFGDVALVNGRAWPYLDVAPRKYRFRMLNGSNSRSYTFQLGDGSLVFQQIGSDGGFLETPVTLHQITLTPGERADVVIDFAQPGLSSGDDVVLMNTRPSHGLDEEDDEHPIADLMQFRIQYGSTADPVVLPQTLRSITRLPEADAVVRRNFLLEDKYDPRVLDSEWLINGAGFDQIDDVVQNNTVEIWNWINKSEMLHPMHLHLVQFQVLGRHRISESDDGDLVPGTDLGVDENERGWKDTVRVGPKEYVRVIARFTGQRNDVDHELFPFHCHILEHEDHEMMRQYQLQYG